MDMDTRNPWTQLALTRLTARKPDELSTSHQAQVADDIQHLERALQQAKELYNSDSSICSLPDELLLDIFTRVRDAAAALALVTDRPDPAPSWDESVTICRRFRRIVIESPSLHTRLSTATHSPNYIGHALARSDIMPIEFGILKPSRNAKNVDRLYELLQQHGHRVNVLSLKITRHCVPLIRSWLQHLPRGDTLSLHHIERLYRQQDNLDVILGSGAFHPVRLSTLVLSHVHFVVTDYTRVYSNLTTLCLVGVILADSPSSKFMDIVGVLASATCLARLTVQDEYLEQSSLIPISLPGDLRDLEYCFEYGCNAAFLSRIVPSSSVQLKLSEDDASQLYEECRQPLVDWMTAVGPPVRAFLQVREHKDLGPDSFQARLDLWKTCEEGSEELCSPNVSYRSTIEPDIDAGIDRLLLNEDLDYSHLHTLELRATISYDLFFYLSEGLDELRLPRLRTLIIRDDVPAQPENEHDRCRIYYIYDILRYRFDQDGPLDTLLTSEYIATALEELGPTPQPPHAGQAGHRALIAYDSDRMPPLSLKDLVSNVSIIATD